MTGLEIFGSSAVGVIVRMALLLFAMGTMLSTYGLYFRGESDTKVIGRGLFGCGLVVLYVVLFMPVRLS